LPDELQALASIVVETADVVKLVQSDEVLASVGGAHASVIRAESERQVLHRSDSRALLQLEPLTNSSVAKRGRRFLHASTTASQWRFVRGASYATA
jgi:hypothetical protein